jgi:hypothetical protein
MIQQNNRALMRDTPTAKLVWDTHTKCSEHAGNKSFPGKQTKNCFAHHQWF